MPRKHFVLAGVAVIGMTMYGCTSSNPPVTPTAGQGSETRNDDAAHEGHEHDGEVGASDMSEMKKELAKLPEADRLAAEKQHMCPVSGEMLGSMGVPLKVAVNGQDVFLCCDGCKDKLLANPDEYLAKLPK